MAHQDDGAWFAPRRRGYGAGLPIHPAGWGLLAGFIVVIGLAALLLPYSIIAYLVVVAAASAAFILISARKTRGGWRWRGGGKE